MVLHAQVFPFPHFSISSFLISSVPVPGFRPTQFQITREATLFCAMHYRAQALHGHVRSRVVQRNAKRKCLRPQLHTQCSNATEIDCTLWAARMRCAICEYALGRANAISDMRLAICDMRIRYGPCECDLRYAICEYAVGRANAICEYAKGRANAVCNTRIA